MSEAVGGGEVGVGADVFAERLLLVIDEGQRVATYKLALLLALIDACADHAGPDGTPPTTLHTRVIAEHVLRLYFPQVRTFLAGDGSEVTLRQINGGTSAVLGAVLQLHLAAERVRARSVNELARNVPAELDRCLDQVERTVARYPILRLQTVGRRSRPFLYDVDWGESVTLRTLHAAGGGLVRFRPGAADHLLRLAPLVRPLIELHWTRMVGRINGVLVEEDRLRTHLFGADRASFPPALRRGLADLQGGACFYCGERLGRTTQIDHFLPWSRWPNDAVENLVLADRCNGHKSDYLVSDRHIDRWADRLDRSAADLVQVASDSKWTADARRSLALVRTCYAHVASGTPLWDLADRFVDADVVTITDRLGRVAV